MPKNFDPADEQEWLDEQEAAVREYLKRHRVPSRGRELDIEWSLPPKVSLWSMETRKPNERVWAISGDLPTDYLVADAEMAGKEAMLQFCTRWDEVSAHLLRDDNTRPSTSATKPIRSNWSS